MGKDSKNERTIDAKRRKVQMSLRYHLDGRKREAGKQKTNKQSQRTGCLAAK